jgi:hypothetical protein
LVLPAQLTIEWFTGVIHDAHSLMVGLPADVSVVSVQGDWPSTALHFMLYSDEFEIVPEGEQPPRITVEHSQYTHVGGVPVLEKVSVK